MKLGPLRLALVLLAGMFWGGQVQAGSSSFQAARQFVAAKQKALNSALAAPKNSKSDAALLAVFDSMFDYAHFARESLGKSRDQLTVAQQRDFRDVLEQLIRASYQKNLRAPEKYAVTYNGESEAKGGGVVVATVATHRKNKREEPLNVDYVVGQGTSGPLVRDIVTGGVSLVTNYRRQFSRLLKKKGFDEMLVMMRKKLKKS